MTGNSVRQDPSRKAKKQFSLETFPLTHHCFPNIYFFNVRKEP